MPFRQLFEEQIAMHRRLKLRALRRAEHDSGAAVQVHGPAAHRRAGPVLLQGALLLAESGPGSCRPIRSIQGRRQPVCLRGQQPGEQDRPFRIARSRSSGAECWRWRSEYILNSQPGRPRQFPGPRFDHRPLPEPGLQGVYPESFSSVADLEFLEGQDSRSRGVRMLQRQRDRRNERQQASSVVPATSSRTRRTRTCATRRRKSTAATSPDMRLTICKTDA